MLTRCLYHRKSLVFDTACLSLQLATNSNHDWAGHTEKGFGMILHRWVTFIAGVGFLYPSCGLYIYDLGWLRHKVDVLPLRHCGRLLNFLKFIDFTCDTIS